MDLKYSCIDAYFIHTPTQGPNSFLVIELVELPQKYIWSIILSKRPFLNVL